MPFLQYELELVHGRSAHPLYAQSLFEEQGYACASIKHVVTRHARMAAANPMLGISEAVGALCRRGDERVAGRLAANGGGQRRCRRANTRSFCVASFSRFGACRYKASRLFAVIKRLQCSEAALESFGSLS